MAFPKEDQWHTAPRFWHLRCQLRWCLWGRNIFWSCLLRFSSLEIAQYITICFFEAGFCLHLRHLDYLTSLYKSNETKSTCKDVFGSAVLLPLCWQKCGTVGTLSFSIFAFFATLSVFFSIIWQRLFEIDMTDYIQYITVVYICAQSIFQDLSGTNYFLWKKTEANERTHIT